MEITILWISNYGCAKYVSCHDFDEGGGRVWLYQSGEWGMVGGTPLEWVGCSVGTVLGGIMLGKLPRGVCYRSCAGIGTCHHHCLLV